jgi:Spy/CpxP family protein refolding chaperone
MTRELKWWSALVLVIVFLAGVACGFFGSMHRARKIFVERRAAHMGERMREHLRRELQLTPEQSAKIDPILDQTSQRLDAIREETGKRVSDTMNESHRQIAPFLTPDQQARLETMHRRHRGMLRFQHRHAGPEDHVP